MRDKRFVEIRPKRDVDLYDINATSNIDNIKVSYQARPGRYSSVKAVVLLWLA